MEMHSHFRDFTKVTDLGRFHFDPEAGKLRLEARCSLARLSVFEGKWMVRSKGASPSSRL
jgi:hypothetical protein